MEEINLRIESKAKEVRSTVRAIDLEPVDQKLANLTTTLQVLAVCLIGVVGGGGKDMERVICHILDSVRDVRATLDMICA